VVIDDVAIFVLGGASLPWVSVDDDGLELFHPSPSPRQPLFHRGIESFQQQFFSMLRIPSSSPSRHLSLLLLGCAVSATIASSTGFNDPTTLIQQQQYVQDDAYDTPPGHPEILFYRGLASLDQEQRWQAQILGVVLERPLTFSRSQNAVLRGTEAVVQPTSELEHRRVHNRLSYFVADTLGARLQSLPNVVSSDDEQLPAMLVAKDGSLQVNSTRVHARHGPGDVMEWRWQPPSTQGEDAVQIGRIYFYGLTGYTIFADVDDTTKDSHVLSLPQLLQRSLSKIYVPVVHMPELFQHLKRTLATDDAPDVAFHYISNTPYSLAPSLDRFLTNSSYPHGPLHLYELLDKDPVTVFRYLDVRDFRLNEARRLAQIYPQRKILLFGDSLQKDPEAYGILLREDPDRLHYQCAFIHKPTGVNARREAIKNSPSTLLKAFNGVSPDRFYFYSDPSEVMNIDIANGRCRPDGDTGLKAGNGDVPDGPSMSDDESTFLV